jgi:hypothetical protein
MRKLILIAISLLALNMQMFAQNDTANFKVISSSQQKWMGGFSWAHGTSYVFYISIAKDAKIIFDTVGSIPIMPCQLKTIIILVA